MFGNNEKKKLEAHIETLSEELQSSQKALADAQKLIADPSGEIANLQKTIADQEEEIKARGSQITSLGNENDTLKAVNEKLGKKLEDLDGPRDLPAAAQKAAEVKPMTVPDSSFTVDGQSYVFISPVFTWKKKRILSEDALNDQELLNVLVAGGFGCIKKV